MLATTNGSPNNCVAKNFSTLRSGDGYCGHKGECWILGSSLKNGQAEAYPTVRVLSDNPLQVGSKRRSGSGLKCMKW